jgi:P27 family predicted phage terminase small subunit
MGRNKTPTKLKELKGTARKDRMIDNEMQPPLVEEIEMPVVLTNEYAKREWLKQTGILSSMGMLSETDTSLLLAYCIETGRYFELVERIKGNITFTTPNGHIQVLPEVTEANKSLQNMIKMSSLFGFNPASRTKIEAPKLKEVDPLDEF